MDGGRGWNGVLTDERSGVWSMLGYASSILVLEGDMVV